MAQRLFSAADRACWQSPARLSHKSGNPVSAPCSSIRRARGTRPRRSPRWQATSSIVSLPARPDARFDCMGLLLLLDRWDVIGIDESGADLVIGGKPQRYRRRALPESAISLWELARRST